jgi:hypothetical protein
MSVWQCKECGEVTKLRRSGLGIYETLNPNHKGNTKEKCPQCGGDLERVTSDDLKRAAMQMSPQDIINMARAKGFAASRREIERESLNARREQERKEREQRLAEEQERVERERREKEEAERQERLRRERIKEMRGKRLVGRRKS